MFTTLQNNKNFTDVRAEDAPEASVESPADEVKIEDAQQPPQDSTEQDTESMSGLISSPDCVPSYVLPKNSDKSM